jgi:Iron-containing redox enzyme
VTSLPEPRGAACAALFAALCRPPGAPVTVPTPDDPEDRDLALYCCYELHYRGFAGVDPAWEWDPALLAARAGLERSFEAELRELSPGPVPEPGEMDAALRELIAADESPSLSRYVEREATLAQAREFVIHRSAYQLKEADPHSWAIPRLSGAPKAALVEIQADEYGGGRPARMHSALFAATMDALGLDSRYGAYLDRIPGVTLATVNLMSLFGLHRRLRGALVGHLAVFEMTSSIPNRRYSGGFRRLGHGADVTAFFDVHVTADAVHESIAAADLAGGLARQDPALAADILWGARALLALDGRWAGEVLSAWAAATPSLRPADAVLA